jgi:hypothetical protein
MALRLLVSSVFPCAHFAVQSIYPLHDTFLRKVKMLKKPKLDGLLLSLSLSLSLSLMALSVCVRAPVSQLFASSLTGAVGKLLELHGDAAIADAGSAVSAPASTFVEPAPLASV